MGYEDTDLIQVGSNEILNLTGEHETFPIDPDTFGWRYFEDEEETSKTHLAEYKAIGRWFSQMAISERPKVIKQWREMAVEADFEWLSDNFLGQLYDDDMGIK